MKEQDTMDELHTGDDARLDCLIDLHAFLEDLNGDDPPTGDQLADDLGSALESCDRLQALLIETIRREIVVAASLDEETPAQKLNLTVAEEYLSIMREMNAPAHLIKLAEELIAERAKASADEPPQARCPICLRWQDDLDGFGVLKCAVCEYCSHPSIDGDVCGLCKRTVASSALVERTPGETS